MRKGTKVKEGIVKPKQKALNLKALGAVSVKGFNYLNT